MSFTVSYASCFANLPRDCIQCLKRAPFPCALLCRPAGHAVQHPGQLGRPDSTVPDPPPPASFMLGCGCRDNPHCTAWLWCDDPNKCRDTQGELLPHYACQLKWEPRQPWGLPPNGTLLARPSTFASGFVKRAPAATGACTLARLQASTCGTWSCDAACWQHQSAGKSWTRMKLMHSAV